MRYTVSLSVLLLVCIFTALISCRKETVDGTFDRGESYYPYAEGLWWEYDMDSTYYDDFSGDTIRATFILREEFDSFFVANTGDTAILIKRYRRVSESDPWQGPRIWWTYKKPNDFVKVEENVPYVKLNLPVKLNGQWNGNRLNFMEPWNYEYTNVDQPFTVNGISFDSTVNILQIDEETLLEKQFYQERYAHHVGLIEKAVTDVKGHTDSDNIPDTIVKPLMNRIKSGIVIRQKIRDWGTL